MAVEKKKKNEVKIVQKITDKEEKIFVELGLLAALEKAPKKRGRPPGSKNRAK